MPLAAKYPHFQDQGDQALLIYLGREISPELGGRVRALARALQEDSLPGVREVIPAYACLEVIYDPLALEAGSLREWVTERSQGLDPRGGDSGRLKEIPVVYGEEHGPDLAWVGRASGLGSEGVIATHTTTDYHCYMVGFTPGFPYLGGLDPRLAVQRLDTPRPANPPGAVGLAGAQTGLYPLGGPGGWRIIGRTPLLAYDPGADLPALMQAGDRVRFRAVDTRDFAEPPDGAWQPDPAGRPFLTVERLAGSVLIQDQGRWGFQDQGIPPGGALDQSALAAANALVGNPPQAAALELTLLGPRLRVLTPGRVAIAGGELGLMINGRPAGNWRAFELNPGDRISFSGPRSGARAYLALAGGVAVRPVLGSRSTYPMGRLGAPLSPGQEIRAYPAPERRAGSGLAAGPVPDYPQEVVIRVMPGPQEDLFSAAGRAAFYEGPFTLSPQADRRGLRLEGPLVESSPGRAGAILSEPNCAGVVQVPPDGRPIILLNEQTVGGYAKIAVVISADLDILAQLRPGATIRFAPVTLKQAGQAARERRTLVKGLVPGRQ